MKKVHNKKDKAPKKVATVLTAQEKAAVINGLDIQIAKFSNSSLEIAIQTGEEREQGRSMLRLMLNLIPKIKDL